MGKKFLLIMAVILSTFLTIFLVAPSFACDFEVCKFEDVNGNGVKDDGEPFINGWGIRITNTYDNAIVNAETSEDGCTGLIPFANPGTFVVWEEERDCYEPTVALVDGEPVTPVPNSSGGYEVTVVGSPGSTHSVLFGNKYTCGGLCRVTGGGVSTNEYYDGTMAYGASKNDNGGVDRYTFGGQAGAPSASEPAYGEWTHHQQAGPSGSFVFHAGTASAPEGTLVTNINCFDEGFCDPARKAPYKQIEFEGLGTFKNIRSDAPELEGVAEDDTLYYFTVHIEDLGEPGKSGKQNSGPGCEGYQNPADCNCADFYSIKIYDGPDLIYHVESFIKGGNLQIHPAID